MWKVASEALQDSELSHAGASRQQRWDGQDLMGRQNLPSYWQNPQRAPGPCGGDGRDNGPRKGLPGVSVEGFP